MKIQNLKFKIQNCKKGFTLMEVIVSLGVIIAALVGVMALVTFSVSSIRVNKSRIIASNLAQEGLEIVRNIRDNNWLNYKRSVSNWRDGLASGNYLVQFDTENLLVFSSTPLKINPAGRYQYNSGSDTLFYSKISIEHIGDNQIKVISQIDWQEDGKSHVVKTETRFYNWLEEPE